MAVARKVFALYSPAKARLVRIWQRSWADNGWKPRLLAPKEADEAGSPQSAIRQRGGGIFVDLSSINFSAKSNSRGPRTCAAYNKPGWLEAQVVNFPDNYGEDDILACGRPLINAAS